jgi:hypothetical protein
VKSPKSKSSSRKGAGGGGNATASIGRVGWGGPAPGWKRGRGGWKRVPCRKRLCYRHMHGDP